MTLITFNKVHSPECNYMVATRITVNISTKVDDKNSNGLITIKFLSPMATNKQKAQGKSSKDQI